MSNDDTYQAISCADHSHYELWIMQRQILHMAWRDDPGREHVGTLQPKDLQTRDGEEFLIATSFSSGERIEIRLDRILHCKPKSSRNVS